MAFSLAPRKRIFDDMSLIRATTSGPQSQFELRVPRQVCRRQGPHSCSVLSWRGRRETTLDHLCAPRRREAVAVGPPGEEGCRTLVGSMGKAMGLEKLAGFLHPTLSERGGAGEGRGESHRRGERTSAVTGQVDPRRPPSPSSAPTAELVLPRSRCQRPSPSGSTAAPSLAAVGARGAPPAQLRWRLWRPAACRHRRRAAPPLEGEGGFGRPMVIAARLPLLHCRRRRLLGGARRRRIWPPYRRRRPSAAPAPPTSPLLRWRAPAPRRCSTGDFAARPSAIAISGDFSTLGKGKEEGEERKENAK